MSGMLTRDELADLLKRVDVVDVAREAKVSTKTVYRLRHKANAPTLDTVERIVSAVRKLNAMRQAA
jgi:DNA-binding phage protein